MHPASPPPLTSSAPTAPVTGRTFAAMGTTMGAWTTAPALLPELDLFFRAWTSRVEAACSRFNDDSDLSRVNRTTGAAVRVGPELLGATTAARLMAEVTHGLYDPTIGAAVAAAGYDRSFEAVVAAGPGPLGPPSTGAWWLLEVDPARQTVTVPEGFQLDLGGSAKGWAVDAALVGLEKRVLLEHPEAGVCLGAGGDIAVAGTPPPGGWPVRLAGRLEGVGAGTGEGIRLRQGAVATSGPGVRRWKRGATEGHHLIDPRTGRPGRSRWSLVTVFSDSCLVADTTATAAWLLDGDAVDWVEEQGLAARFVDGRGRLVVSGDIERWVTEGARSSR